MTQSAPRPQAGPLGQSRALGAWEHGANSCGRHADMGTGNGTDGLSREVLPALGEAVLAKPTSPRSACCVLSASRALSFTCEGSEVTSLCHCSSSADLVTVRTFSVLTLTRASRWGTRMTPPQPLLAIASSKPGRRRRKKDKRVLHAPRCPGRGRALGGGYERCGPGRKDRPGDHG